MAVTHDAFISYSHSTDGELGPAVERGLERLAKPLLRLRALDIFIDRTSLSASPALWSSILNHLSGSKWFILIASPDSAASPWCSQEVVWWLEHRSADHLLVVLSNGDIVWDPVAADFDWSRTTALSRDLCERFQDEPLYVDLRWVKDAEHLSLSSPRFREAVVSLAAPIHSVRKDELDSADVRQLRRNRLFVRTGVLVLMVATGVAIWQAIVATREREEATRQRDIALARYLSIQAAAAPSTDHGILLAIESLRRRAFVETDSLLRTLIRSRPTTQRAAAMPEAAASSSVLVWQFSPSGRYFVTALTDNRVALWDVERLRVLREWPMGTFVSHAKFAPDERQLAVAGGRKVAIIDVPDGDSRTVLEGLGEISSLDFNPDGTRLAVGLWTNYPIGRQRDGHIVIDVSLGTPVGEAVTQRDTKAVAFSPDGQYLATGDGGAVTIWDAEGEFTTASQHYEQVTQWNFEASTNALVTLGRDHGLTVHAATATSRALPSWNLDAVNGFAVDPSGDTLAAIRNRVIVLLSRAGNSVQQIPLQDGNVHSMQFLNRLHLQVRWDDRAVVYETRTGKAVAVLDRKLVASRGDGMLLATAEQHSGERWVQIWQVGGGDPLMQTRHDDTVCSVDFDADGSRILTASEDGTARIWTVPDGEEIVRVEHERPLTAAWFSPDGKTAVSAGNGRALWWETDSGQIIHRLVYRAEHRPYARLLGECEQDIRKLAVSFARPVPLLASATEQEEVDVYDFANKTAIQTVTHPMDEDPLANRGDALRIEFDADGSELRTANSNRERPVRTWDIATGQLINSAEAIVIPRMRWPLPLGPGDRYRADRVDDGLLIRDDEATATKLEHETHINDAAMSPDGRYVATTGADGTVNLFLFRTEDLIAAACRRVAADLTQKQWDQYVGVGEARRICVSRPGD